MSIKIIPTPLQASGQFNGGAILENKPIGFPQDGGTQQPYSNLFYWANAWSDNGGLIGEHPHKMFEIMSFVIDGQIEHYDSKFDRWCKKRDIKHIRSAVHSPTTCGKVERLFQTLKKEIEFCNKDLEMFRMRYNHFRPHMSLNNKSPAEIYFKVL